MSTIKKAYFAGGCFWCTEAIFNRLKYVLNVNPGYSGGLTKDPTYEEVCRGDSGHAETIEIIYNSEKIDFHFLLEIFFKTHDPTTINRQGNDVGPHYRSIVFYSDNNEKKIAEKFIYELNKSGYYQSKIVTELLKFNTFYEAEDYHSDYFENNKNQPYCKVVILPKVRKFEGMYKKNLKNN